MSSSSSSSDVSCIKKYTIILVGSYGCGKSTFITRHKTGEFTTCYNTTNILERTKLKFYTSHGQIELTIYEITEDSMEKMKSLYKEADGAIIMFDLTSKETYKKVPEFYNTIRSVCPNIPVVLCGNKVDCKDRRVQPKDITFFRKAGIGYYDISAKSNYNFEKPFLELIRKISNQPSCHFIEGPPLAPPEIVLSKEQIEAYSH